MNRTARTPARATNGFAVPADRAAYDGLNFDPIFTAAANRVQYYHHEQDGGNPNDANDSFTNLRGINARAVGTVLGKPASLPVGRGSHSRRPTTWSRSCCLNTGDAPLTHHRPGRSRLTRSTSARRTTSRS